MKPRSTCEDNNCCGLETKSAAGTRTDPKLTHMKLVSIISLKFSFFNIFKAPFVSSREGLDFKQPWLNFYIMVILCSGLQKTLSSVFVNVSQLHDLDEAALFGAKLDMIFK